VYQAACKAAAVGMECSIHSARTGGYMGCISPRTPRTPESFSTNSGTPLCIEVPLSSFCRRRGDLSPVLEKFSSPMITVAEYCEQKSA
jgi:hypothetical protein